jgi:pimeloyl-ACP methyl ester carboxylesterase
MAYVTANGYRHWYEVNGEGEPVVQVHGAALGHYNFMKVTPIISKHFKVYDYDMIGYHGSDKPTDVKFSLEWWADDLAAMMDALDLPKAHIHSTSFGAMVGVIFAAKYPEKTHSLVAGCFMTRYDEAAQMRVRIFQRLALSAGMVNELAEAIALYAFTRQYLETDEGRKDMEWCTKYWLDNTPEQFSAGFAAMTVADLEPYLSQIKAPTLLQVGEQDQMTPLDTGASGFGMRRASQTIPNARLHIIPNCNHLHIVERPEETAAEVIKFLKEHPLQ